METETDTRTQARRSMAMFLLIFTVMAVGIAAVGYISYHNYERQFRAQVESQLASIAGLKVHELQDWRNERMADAEVLYQNPDFSERVRRYLEDPADAGARFVLQSWLDEYQAYDQYDQVLLLDVNGVERISSPVTPEPVAVHMDQEIAAASSAGQITLLDFHRDTADGPIRLSLLIPIYTQQDEHLLGLVVLFIDPNAYLYPYIQEWPIPSTSAETALVRREGDYALYLSDLRFREDAVLNLRVPLEDTQRIAAKAVLGQEGIVDGVDYRGAPVIAYVNAVPDSPWFLATRVDVAEVYAPLRARLWQTVVFFGALVAAAGAALGLIWWQQRARYYHGQAQTAQALRLLSARQQALLSAIPDIVMEVDEHKVYTWANQTGIEFFGEDVLGQEVAFYFEGEQNTYDTVQPLFDGCEDVIYVESWQRRKDGEKRLLAWWCRVLKNDSGNVTGALSSARDITESRRAEEQILAAQAELQRLLAEADQSRRALLSVVEDQKRTEEALQRYVERLRTLRAIDGVTLATWSAEDTAQAVLRHIRKLIPCQWASVMALEPDAREGVVLALDADVETPMEAGSRVPAETTGIVADLGRGNVRVLEDIAALPRPSTMEHDLQAAGIRAYISVPLISHGVLVGSLSLGAAGPGAFTSEHVDVASELAGQLAISIRQARLYEQIQHHAEELEQQVATRTTQLTRRTAQLQVAAEVARDATTAHDLNELLNRSVALVRDRFGFYHAGIFLTDERGKYAVLRAATGDAGRQMLENGHRLKVGEVGIVGHACASGEPRIAPDTGADAAHFDNPLLPDTRSEMALPMRVAGRVIGALDVQSTDESAFRQDDVEILQVMADQLAVAIEKTRLFEQVQATLEERLRTVVSNVPIILFALDREGVFTLSEGKGLNALGVKPGERVGKSAFALYRDAPEVLDDYRRALAGEVVTSVREQAGAVFDTWWSPLRDASGEITGVIGVAADVTERHRMQEQMQRQERLAAVGQLAGGIAHDFNNFLTTIVFYAHLLLRDQNGKRDIASIAETIIGEANRAADLVRQVLDFSRRSMMETRPVNLASFVEEVMDILQKTLPESIQVKMEVGSDNCTVEIDPTRIQQVIVNLALNSRDAMPESGELCIGLSRVTVGSTRAGLPEIADLELTAGDWVRLSVQDTGTGMDARVRAHLFEPFFTTKGPKGNGLGLAQVYGIVKQHRGEIHVETELNHGTTFQIYLPAYVENHAREGQTDADTAGAIPQGRGETILFVEDEDSVRDAGERVLQSLGYRVLTASDGREALEVLRNNSGVDLVLTDMIMPEMGGRELIQKVKQIAPGVKAMVMTGYTIQEDVQALRDSGFADIVYKPLEIGVLSRTVRRILDADSSTK
jgi:PAS domain S-box-containing protein